VRPSEPPTQAGQRAHRRGFESQPRKEVAAGRFARISTTASKVFPSVCAASRAQGHIPILANAFPALASEFGKSALGFTQQTSLLMATLARHVREFRRGAARHHRRRRGGFGPRSFCHPGSARSRGHRSGRRFEGRYARWMDSVEKYSTRLAGAQHNKRAPPGARITRRPHKSYVKLALRSRACVSLFDALLLVAS